MSGDKSGSKRTGKRPGPTIEGTATEVSVTSDGEEAGKEDVGTEPGSTAEIESDKPDTSAHAADETDRGQEAGAQPAGRSFMSVLLGGLVSLFTHAVAGLAGGLAVLVAVTMGYLPFGTDEAEINRLDERMTKLETAPRPPDNTATLTILDERIAALDKKTGETRETLTGLSKRVGQLETNLASMAEAAKDGSSVADAAAITQQINEAEQRLDAKIKSEIQSALTGAGSGTGVEPAVIDKLQNEIASIDAKLKALAEAKLGSDDAQLQSEITALDERLGRIEATLPALAKAMDEETAETKKATLAIALANLRDAVNQGRPFTSELSTLAVLSPGAIDLGSLLDYEETGIPTVRELTASFENLRNAALTAPAQEEDETIIGRLLGSAESLVKIRRIDEETEGTSAAAILARADAKLKEGDLTAAVAEVQTLTAPVNEVFAAWLDDAKARLDAPRTLRRLQDILLVSIGANTAGQDNAGDKNGQ